MIDHPSTRRAPAPTSPLPWLIALAGPVVVSLSFTIASRDDVVRVRRLSELAAGRESRGRLIGIVQGELVSLLPVRECKFEHGASAHDLPEITHNGVLARHGARQPVPVLSS